MFACSCARDAGAKGSGKIITIEAYMADADGKTTLDDGGSKVLWEPGDEIKAFFGANGYRFTSLNGKNSAKTVFSCSESIQYDASEGSDGVLMYAVYPYDEDFEMEGSKIVASLKDKQPAQAGSFASKLGILAAKSSSTVAAFRNVCGGIRFSVQSSDIHSVVLSSNGSEALSGKVKIAFDGENPVIGNVIEGKNSVTLTAAYGSNLEPGKWYYLVTLPGTFADGLTLRLNKEKTYDEVVIDGPRTIKRGTFGSIANADAGLSFNKEREDEWDEGDPVVAPTYYYKSPDANNIVGVDQFDRSFKTLTSTKSNYLVGMFFWAWIGQPYATDVYDATKIMAMPNGMDMLFWADTPGISPDGQAHYWGEPLWGYYNSADEWVLRKQLEMITLAGVDFIYWDHTNAVTYSNVELLAAKILHEMNEAGWKAPKMMSYTHSHSLDTVRDLYNNIYKAQQYPDTWFCHPSDGKPCIIAYQTVADDKAEAATRGDDTYNPKPLSDEILNYFHFFYPQWPNEKNGDKFIVHSNGFPWVEWQNPAPMHTEAGVMCVSVASHPGCPMSRSLTYGTTNWGRGWNGSYNDPDQVDRGGFFQSQWDNAIAAKPSIISVGGWNEWIAYKQPLVGDEYTLVDACSKEYSRDIEPMNGGYEDSFYLQLIRNLRAYKGIRTINPTNNAKTIKLKGRFTQWDDVKYVERKPDYAQIERDSYGDAKTVHYDVPAPENALTEVRVSYDADNIYFFIKCKEDISDPEKDEHGWCNIFIGAGEPTITGTWESYTHMVGYYINGDTMWTERFVNGYNREGVGSSPFFKKGNMMHVTVPRNLVGLSSAKSFHFKVTMGIEDTSNIMNTYTSGSAMPAGRLSYMYYMK